MIELETDVTFPIKDNGMIDRKCSNPVCEFIFETEPENINKDLRCPKCEMIQSPGNLLTEEQINFLLEANKDKLNKIVDDNLGPLNFTLKL